MNDSQPESSGICVNQATPSAANTIHPTPSASNINHPTPSASNIQQNTSKSPASATTPRKRKLKGQISYLRLKVHRLNKRMEKLKNPAEPEMTKREIKQVFHSLDKLLPSKTAKFVKSQITAHKRKSSFGNRWTLNDKMFALSIFYHSRKAYRLLRNLFILPSKSTLTTLLGKSKIYPGFHDNIFLALKKRIDQFSDQDRQCVLLYDEMSLKCSLSYNTYMDCVEGLEDYGAIGKTRFMANNALVFMVRGLANKWKQCIGYFLSSGPTKGDSLQYLTRQAIDKLSSIGLRVRVVICDQGSNNRNHLETQEGISVDRPYFNHNNDSIYVMYDPPHLLKNIRNNLKKHGFLHNGLPVKWKYIEEFYEFDKQGPIRMAPKLTDDHLDLPMFTKMRVNLAAQVLSHSVAAGISTLQRLGHLHQEAKNTAEFVEMMDQLFNAFNSSTLSSSRRFGQAFSNTSGHKQFLEDCFDYLDHLTLSNEKVVPCINGWKINIRSLFCLWDDLNQNQNFKFLLTNRLNQDCVENLFSIIRGKGGHRDNPDAREFRAAYRQVVFDQLLMPSDGSNCKLDADSILLNLASFESSESCSPSDHATSKSSNFVPDRLSGVDMLPVLKAPPSLPVQNVEAYMAGYLLRKANMRECSTCSSQLIYDIPPNTDLYAFLRAKAYKESNTLVYPTEPFVQLVEQWESKFSIVFEAVLHMTGVHRRLCKNADESCVDFLTCSDSRCQMKLFTMLSLYMKVRLHFALKTSNRANKISGQKRNRKMLKLQHL